MPDLWAYGWDVAFILANSSQYLMFLWLIDMQLVVILPSIRKLTINLYNIISNCKIINDFGAFLVQFGDKSSNLVDKWTGGIIVVLLIPHFRQSGDWINNWCQVHSEETRVIYISVNLSNDNFSLKS